jgi:hypothetical protein
MKDYFLVYYKKGCGMKPEVDHIERIIGSDILIKELGRMLLEEKDDRPLVCIYAGECVIDLS